MGDGPTCYERSGTSPRLCVRSDGSDGGRNEKWDEPETVGCDPTTLCKRTSPKEE